MNSIITTTNLCKSYELDNSNSQTILNNVNITVDQGEFVAIMGPSGCGKSTLLHSMSSMDLPTSGNVAFDHDEITTMKDKKLARLRLKKMGFIFQHTHLLKSLTILDNIVLPGYTLNERPRAEVNERAQELMERMGISDLADKQIAQVSGGQLQRAAICRALINTPDVVFGDEPTGALNSKAANDVMDILGQVHTEGTTLVLVTHDAKVAARADRVLFMRDGDIVSEEKFRPNAGDQVDSSRQSREQIVTQQLLQLNM